MKYFLFQKKEIEKSPDKPEKTPEELIFDKAIKAGTIVKRKNTLPKLIKKLN